MPTICAMTSILQPELYLGVHPMPTYPNGFVAGTKVMTSRGPVNIEDLKPGDMIQVQPVGRHPCLKKVSETMNEAK
jgi:hypothetical protein